VNKILPWLGVKVTEVLFGTEDAKKLEEVGKAGGILVEEVIHNSPAEKSGLQADDIIMSFNSRKTRTLREFLSDLAGCEPGDEIPMCIIRQDYRKTIYVTLTRQPSLTNI
jgi:S1-C subfamily serine protease